ncbi:MAG: helix-turn-helix domain-containing protein [Pseudomonadota bacterium]
MPEAAQEIQTKRRSAQQARSKAKIKLILETTLSLLSQHPADQVTTNKIAKHAEISIGTLYQYFSSKEDIFFRLYQDWLRQTLDTMDRVDAQFPSERGFEAYIDTLFHELSRDDRINSPGHWQLRRAMASSEALSALEFEHGKQVFARLIAFQERFGRQIDPEKAIALAHFQNQVSIACLTAAALAGKLEGGDTALDWYRRTLHFIFDVDKLK